MMDSGMGKPGSPADRKGSLVFSRKVGENCRHIAVELSEATAPSAPGQFFLVREWGVFDPLLGRPLASTASGDRRLEFLFQVTGRGTSRLASLPPGAALELRGPCGNGFPAPVGEKLLLVAGTLGIAPFLGAVSALGEKVDVTAVLGVPGRGWEPFAEWCEDKIPGIRLNSDDGSLGRRGDPVEDSLTLVGPGRELWGCGPEAMLRELGRAYEKGCEKVLVSLERRMGCGIGGCLSCSITTPSGMKRVCVDGPVFDWREGFGDPLRN